MKTIFLCFWEWPFYTVMTVLDRAGIKLTTPVSAVRLPTDCTTGPCVQFFAYKWNYITFNCPSLPSQQHLGHFQLLGRSSLIIPSLSKFSCFFFKQLGWSISQQIPHSMRLDTDSPASFLTCWSSLQIIQTAELARQGCKKINLLLSLCGKIPDCSNLTLSCYFFFFFFFFVINMPSVYYIQMHITMLLPWKQTL